MKFIITFLFAIMSCLSSYSQGHDSLIYFEYRTMPEKWILRITNRNTFEFVAFNNKEENGLVINGNYGIIDSTIYFYCDSLNKGISRIRNDSSYGINAQNIIRNESFKIIENYFIPKQNNLPSSKPDKTIYGKYYTGDNLSSNTIEFKKDHTYIIWDNSCKLKEKEEGKWALKNNFITFSPYRKRSSGILELLLKENKVFIYNSFLIGTLRRIQYTEPKNYLIKETFLYFIKIVD